VRKELKRFPELIFALSILMFFCLAYLGYEGLGEIHFLSHNLTLKNFENVEQEDLVMDPPDQLKGIVSASFANLSHLGIHPCEDSFLLPFQPFSFEQKTSILRC
jgi:hypothetical protein